MVRTSTPTASSTPYATTTSTRFADEPAAAIACCDGVCSSIWHAIWHVCLVRTFADRRPARFMSKKKEILASDVHWVEIDLLRSGDPSILTPPLRPSDYRVLVS